LLRTGRLYFATRSGLVENRHFRAELFQKVMAGAATVACQNGRMIDVRIASRKLCKHPEFPAGCMEANL